MMQKSDCPALGVTLCSARLPSGLRVYVVPRPGWRRSRAALAIDYGAADRRFFLDGKHWTVPAGTAHYLEHKMFDMPDGSVDGVFAALGADANAYTSYGATSYHFTCAGPVMDPLAVLMRFVSTPYFTAETVEKERGIIAQEIAEGEDDPVWAAYQGCLGLLYGGHPLGDDVAGTAASIRDVTPELLLACHRAFYVPGNMALCLAGDVDPEAVERAALAAFPGEEAPLPVREPVPVSEGAAGERRAERRMDVSAPQFCAGARLGPAGTGPEELRRRLTAELAVRCLFGRGSPAYVALYEQGLLNDTFSAEIEQAAGESFLTVSGESSAPEKVLETLTAPGALEIGPALFHRQKKAVYGGLIRMADDFWELTESLAEGCFGGFSPLDAPQALEEISLTDVSGWAQERLAGGRFALSVIRPKEE